MVCKKAVLGFFFCCVAQCAVVVTPRPGNWIPSKGSSEERIFASDAGQFGFAAAFKQAGLQRIIDSVLPSLVKKITGMSIPGISGEKDSIKYSLSNIKVESLTYTSVTVDLSKDIAFQATGVSVHVNLDWSYKEKIWPHVPYGSGSADASADGSNFNIALGTSVTSDGHLQLAVDTCSVDLGNFKITIHGSILSWLYDILIDLFKGTLKSAIQKAVQSELQSLISNTVNQILNSYSYRYKIDSQTEVDFTFPAAPKFGSSMMLAGITGAFESIQDNTPPALPHGADITNQPVTTRAVDLFVDQYLPNSGFYTYFKTNRLQGYIYDSQIPAGFPIRLNTSSWKLLLPELYQKYPNQAMRIHFGFQSFAPNVAFAANNASKFEGTGYTGFQVTTDPTPSANSTWIPVFDLGVEGLVGKIEVAFTTTSTDTRLTGDIGTATFTLSLVNTTVGPIDVADLNSLIELAVNTIALPQINKYLHEGVPIPSIKGLTFTSPVLDIYAGYLRVAADINYVPPAYIFSPVLHVQGGY